jgi:hypothetical protein
VSICKYVCDDDDERRFYNYESVILFIFPFIPAISSANERKKEENENLLKDS